MPLILCEYTHAMGNSNGGLERYWDLFYSGTNMQGAFVWDWVDQGLRIPVPEQYRDSIRHEDVSRVRRMVGGSAWHSQRQQLL